MRKPGGGGGCRRRRDYIKRDRYKAYLDRSLVVPAVPHVRDQGERGILPSVGAGRGLRRSSVSA